MPVRSPGVVPDRVPGDVSDGIEGGPALVWRPPLTFTTGHLSVLRWVERCESDAAEAYARALAGLGEDPRVRRSLDLVRTQHERAAALVRDQLVLEVDADGEEVSSRTACPSWADVAGTVLRPTLEALRARESQWTQAYVALRDDPVLTADTHALLQSTLLPQQRGHVAILDRLLAAI